MLCQLDRERWASSTVSKAEVLAGDIRLLSNQLCSAVTLWQSIDRMQFDQISCSIAIVHARTIRYYEAVASKDCNTLDRKTISVRITFPKRELRSEQDVQLEGFHRFHEQWNTPASNGEARHDINR